jgi:PAS domain S-box-containing protein
VSDRERGVEPELPLGLEGLSKDLDATRRRETRLPAEERLARQQRLNRALIQDSPAFFIALDPDHRILFANEAMLGALDYRRDELDGADYLERLVPPEEHSDVLSVFETTLRSGRAMPSMSSLLTRDGNRLLVEWRGRSITAADGSLEFYFGIGIDATERKLSEDALQRERDEAQRYLDLAGVMFLALDDQGRVSMINNKGCEILGVSEGDIVGSEWFSGYLPPECRAQVRETFRRIVAGDIVGAEHYENAVLTASGEERLLEWHNTVLRDGTGRITGTLSSGIDVTDRTRDEAVRRLVYRIGSAIHECETTRELFVRIQQELGSVIKAENFFIALYDSEHDTISLPYFVDKKDQDDFDSFPAGKTLTGYVLRNDTSLLMTRAELDEWVERGIVDIVGTPSLVWLGVPLRVHGEVIGALVVQDYEDTSALGEDDREMLEFVSGQIGFAIERKRAEEELRESEARNRAILQALPDILFQMDRNGTFLSCESPKDSALAMPEEAFLGRNIAEVFPEDFSRTVMKALRTTLREGRMEVIEYELAIPYPDGELRAFECRLVPGSENSVLTLVRDITDRRRAEKLLQTLNRAALNMERTLTPDSIFAAVSSELHNVGIESALFMVDGETRTAEARYVSGGADSVDDDAERARPRRARKARFSVDLSESPALRKAILESRTIFVDDMRAALGGGSEAIGAPGGRCVFAPLHSDERVFAILAVQSEELGERDLPAVTAFANQLAAAWRKGTLMQELAESLDELRETQDQLLQAQKIEAVGRLAGGVAHDFNNLLTAITGYTDLLLSRTDLDDTVSSDLSNIRKAADQAAALTRQLLAFSRRQPLEKKTHDLNRVMVDMEAMVRRLIGEDIELSTELADCSVCASADAGQIEQVVLNLAVNARDAMPDGGRLTIRTDVVELDEESTKAVHDARPGRYVRVTVEDNGCGIPSNVIDQIFEPFFSTKGPGKGTGLGLSVVYGIVRQHDGWINVYSEPDRGTAFRIYLPADGETAVEESTESVQYDELKGGGQRILLVEDEEVVREFASRALRQSGYTVFEAKAADEALELFEKEGGRFELIFSDVVLPDKSGLRLVDDLLERVPNLRILLSSGYTDQKSQWPAIQEKGFRFLQKPYTLPDLLATIQEMVHGEDTKPADGATLQ